MALKEWAERELDGYNNGVELPSYRQAHVHAKGHFQGAFGRSVSNYIFPSGCLEERHRAWAEQFDFRDGVGVYEQLLNEGDRTGSLTVTWPGNLVAYYSRKILRDMVMVGAYQEVPRGSVVGLLDSVRNRVLKLALELQAQVGEDNQDLKHITHSLSERVTEGVIQHIYGGQVFVSSGQSKMRVEQQNVLAAGLS